MQTVLLKGFPSANGEDVHAKVRAILPNETFIIKSNNQFETLNALPNFITTEVIAVCALAISFASLVIQIADSKAIRKDKNISQIIAKINNTTTHASITNIENEEQLLVGNSGKCIVYSIGKRSKMTYVSSVKIERGEIIVENIE